MDRLRYPLLRELGARVKRDPGRFSLVSVLAVLSILLLTLPFSGEIAIPSQFQIYPYLTPTPPSPTPEPTPEPPPRSGVTSIEVTASDIGAHKTGAGGFFTIVPGPVTFDLMQIGGIEEVLGSAEMETGKYTQIRLFVDSVIVVLDDVPTQAVVPSGVIKLVGQNIPVDEGFITTVTLDFDADKQLTIKTDGSITFKPTVKLIVTQESEPAAQLSVDTSQEPTATLVVAVTDSSEAAVDNALPVANDDTATTDEDTAVSIAVLANDTDADVGTTLTVTNLTQPANGSVAVNADETVTYTPDENFNGADSFTYTANDATIASNIATVTIDVAAVNDDPVALDDQLTVDLNSVDNNLDVLVNDSRGPTNESGQTLTITAVGATDHAGTVGIAGDGLSLIYTPATTFAGDETFTYTITDNGDPALTDTATVNVTVNVTVGAVGVTVEIPLVVGYNLVGVPVEFESAINSQDLADQIVAQGGLVPILLNWNVNNQGFDSYFPGLGLPPFPIVPGKGYFLLITQLTSTGTWQVTGNPIDANVAIDDLVVGYNVLSVPKPASGYDSQTLADSIVAAGGTSPILLDWNVNDQGFNAYFPGVGLPPFAIDPEFGYFVLLTGVPALPFTP